MASGRDGVVLGSARPLFEGGTAVGLDDEQLVARFLATRDEAAFAALVARHGPLVLRVCRGVAGDEADAHDAFQATFLVLARRMGSIRRRQSLPSWLHGVARRVALRARADAARRRRRERALAGRLPTATPADPPAADFAALHEEIDRLPAPYRVPVILCYLDGMTYEAAARHLDCPLGTLSIRLKRARDRLRVGLTRRGVAVPVALIGVGLIPTPAPAAVPAGLATLAVRTALISIGSKATVGGTVPPAVALLAARMTTMMRLKMIAVGLLITGGVAMAAAGSLAMPTPPSPEQAPPAVAPPLPERRPYLMAFPGGAIIEVVGVSAGPARPDSWSTPAGLPLTQAPLQNDPADDANFKGNQFSADDDRSWEVAVRVIKAAEGDLFKLQISSPNEHHVHLGRLVAHSNLMSVSIPGVYSFRFVCPKEQASCVVRCDLVSGPWRTQTTSHGRDIIGFGRDSGSVILGTAHQIEDMTWLTVGKGRSSEETRVIAVDLDGVEHSQKRSQSVKVKDFEQMELEYDLPLAKIKEFRFQSRPAESKIVDQVILRPRAAPTPVEPARKEGAD